MKPKTITAKELKSELMKESDFRSEYNKLQPEMQIANQVIEARTKQSLTQAELADRVGTGQAAISRLEGMRAKPSLTFLEKVAQALDTEIQVNIQP